MITVIMQPTYLPWMGYFDLIDQSDCFIFLDTVQFAKQSWQQRNRIKTPQGVLWLTVPVHQALGQKIVDVKIADLKAVRKKHWSSITGSYARCAHFELVANELEKIYMSGVESLADLNIALIRALAGLMNIATRYLRTSEMAPSEKQGEELLTELCSRVGSDVYLSPPGSSVYLRSDRAFTDRGIKVAFQQFEHPVYLQRFGEFVPYLSVIDLLMNVGPGALEVIRQGRRPWKSVEEMISANGRDATESAHGE